MPYVKSTVHITRIAGAALKSFTHGYAQTVVAASQSSHAASNTPTGPLCDTLLGRYRKHERGRLSNVYGPHDGSRHASTNAAAPKPESILSDAGLEKYLDAWQKHQRTGTKEWQQFQFAKRLEWQPPSVVPANVKDAEYAQEVTQSPEAEPFAPATGLKRSYTTSALDNFGKAFINDEAAEAAALEQVNNAIAEEIQKSKDDLDQGLLLQARSSSISSSFDPSSSPEQAVSTAISSAESLAEPIADVAYTRMLLELVDNKHYAEIPLLFQEMVRAGVQQPPPGAYAALLKSVVELSHGKHQKISRVKEVYSDMVRKKVIPDSATASTLLELLAERSVQCTSIKTSLDTRLARYGGLEKLGKFMFASSQSEQAIVQEDSSLTTALKLFDQQTAIGSNVSTQAFAALVIACADQGRLQDMERVYARMPMVDSSIFPSMIAAFGKAGDLLYAVKVYDAYLGLAVSNDAGKIDIVRIDNQVYAALIKAFGLAGRTKDAFKFFGKIQQELQDRPDHRAEMHDVVALDALLPVELTSGEMEKAFDLVPSLSVRAQILALSRISAAAADLNLRDSSVRAFDMLSQLSADLALPATALLAMHVRNANVEAAESYWRILEVAPAITALIEPTTMRAIALIGLGQAERGLRQSRRMFSRIRENQAAEDMAEAVMLIDEAIELMASFMLKHLGPIHAEASAEVLRMMMDNGGVLKSAEHLVARLGPEQIASLSPASIELLTQIQGGMILDESSTDLAGPARFGCLLEQIVTRALMPSSETETIIERTLINVDSAQMSQLWNTYRWPQAPQFTPVVSPVTPAQPSFDDSFDPYAARIDVKGSNIINDLLDRPHGRRMNEALTKFRNMRRVGRIPRMFTYGKLIESAAKEKNMSLAREILEMAKQDVPYDVRYHVVRYGWQQILDHMISGCLDMNRRDLADQYHQDLLDMGLAPSANTFGLYITSLKETTKTFDEASEAVKIFLRSKSEGVEPTPFLYNALIGKLGKARRIDDCLFYFAEMRNTGVRPTSVTYGTIINALVRVSDEKFAEEMLEEMEACSNYKPRPAPYHSLIQFFLQTKRDRSKVLSYYERMLQKGISPTVHTFKLMIDTHATLEPVNMSAAEHVLEEMLQYGIEPDAVHYASLIHAKGCVTHDMNAARQLFDRVVVEKRVRVSSGMYQALFEGLNANHLVSESDALLADMKERRVEYTSYIANALIHGWTMEKNLGKAREAFDRVPKEKLEPTTYEAMVRAYVSFGERDLAKATVREALSRGYPSAVSNGIANLIR